MRRLVLFILLLCIPLSLLPAFTGTISMQDRVPDGTLYHPGSVVVRPVVITYDGPVPAEFRTEVELPETWRLLTGNEAVVFEEAGSQLVLVGFHLPENAGAGEYSATMTLRIGDEDARELPLPVTVLPRLRLSCVMLEQPDYILSGAAYKTVFGCSNTGNVPISARASVYSSSGFDIRAEVPYVKLLPGETVRLSVIVDTPISLYTQVKHILRMELRAEEDEKVKASAVSMVDVIPRTTGRESRYNTIVGNILTRGVFQHGEVDLFGLETELTGQGFLDEEKKTFLYFRAKEPLAGAGTLVQDKSEYLVKVTGDDYSAGIGNQFYSLSPLTEISRYGTGVSLSAALGDLSLSGFAMDNLLELRKRSRVGGKLSYRFSDRGIAAVNILEAEEGGRWTSGSLEGHFLLPSGNRLEWEYASSDTNTATDDAFYTNLGGSTDSFSYNLKYLKAGPRYRGSLEDLEQIIASIGYVPAGSIRLRALLGRKSYNLDQVFPDVLSSSQVGISWTGLESTFLSADVMRTREESRENLPTERIEREIYRLGLIRRTPEADLKMTYEIGSRLDVNTFPKTFSERMSVGLDLSSLVLGDIRTSLGYTFRNHEDTRTPYSDVTLAWEKEISGRVGVSAVYRTVNSQRSYFRGSDNLAARLDIAFPNQADMAVTVEYGPDRRSGNPEDLKVTLAFSAPFPIPVSLKKNIGRIEGKVLDAETGKPTPDVVLRLGNAVAATDPFGQYSFHSLAPGIHRLFIDPASLPADYIPAERLPLEIVVSDTTAEKDLRIIRASSITGRIVLYRFDRNYRWLGGDQGAAYIDPTGLPGVLLTAAGPTGIRRALSGDDGNFSFPPLVPGEWKLTVPEGALPEGYFLARGEFDLVLEPGQKEDVIIKIFPKVRQIRFIDEGTVLEEEAPGTMLQEETAE